MTKSIIGWVGGKAKLMWLINLLAPSHCERSIDVFGGSATVTLNLDMKPNLMVYNDYNADLVNLIRCARDNTLELMHEIKFLALNSHAEFDLYKKFINKKEFTDEDLCRELKMAEIMFDPLTAKEVKELLITKSSEEKDIKRAAAYYKLLRYSFNANGETYGGKKCNVCNFFYDMWRFSKYFADVAIENKDFQALIKQYDRKTAFIYCDPPYFEAEGFYAVAFPKSDHERLRDTLLSAEGYVMVSYNNSEYIKELYKDFYIFYTTRPNSMARKEGEIYEELVMTNYNPEEFIQNRTEQINLFGDTELDQSQGSYKLIHAPLKPLKV